MDWRAFTFPSLRESGSKEWISCAHDAVSAAIFKIFEEEFGQAVLLRIGQMWASYHGNLYAAIPRSRPIRLTLWAKRPSFCLAPSYPLVSLAIDPAPPTTK